ncbi:MAG: c-type cytochrome [Gallionella sp.]|jgi:cytochrome c|nr:c-type cytochrome [Gallionella sp.]MCK9355088.1 c-type cytochrome [Gallionella sp.]
MKTRYLIAAAAALTLSATAFAADNGEATFKKSSCVSCHQLDKKSVGPALKDISAKYASDKAAQTKLETKVRNGGSGAFGTMPMPATPKTVADADIKAMVAWILSQK